MYTQCFADARGGLALFDKKVSYPKQIARQHVSQNVFGQDSGRD